MWAFIVPLAVVVATLPILGYFGATRVKTCPLHAVRGAALCSTAGLAQATHRLGAHGACDGAQYVCYMVLIILIRTGWMVAAGVLWYGLVQQCEVTCPVALPTLSICDRALLGAIGVAVELYCLITVLRLVRMVKTCSRQGVCSSFFSADSTMMFHEFLLWRCMCQSYTTCGSSRIRCGCASHAIPCHAIPSPPRRVLFVALCRMRGLSFLVAAGVAMPLVLCLRSQPLHLCV